MCTIVRHQQAIHIINKRYMYSYTLHQAIPCTSFTHITWHDAPLGYTPGLQPFRGRTCDNLIPVVSTTRRGLTLLVVRSDAALLVMSF